MKALIDVLKEEKTTPSNFLLRYQITWVFDK